VRRMRSISGLTGFRRKFFAFFAGLSYVKPSLGSATRSRTHEMMKGHLGISSVGRASRSQILGATLTVGCQCVRLQSIY
jgi:hypothetical protein